MGPARTNHRFRQLLEAHKPQAQISFRFRPTLRRSSCHRASAPGRNVAVAEQPRSNTRRRRSPERSESEPEEFLRGRGQHRSGRRCTGNIGVGSSDQVSLLKHTHRRANHFSQTLVSQLNWTHTRHEIEITQALMGLSRTALFSLASWEAGFEVSEDGVW